VFPAIFLDDFCDCAVCSGFDEVVGIDEFPAEEFCYSFAVVGFSAAAHSCEDDVHFFRLIFWMVDDVSVHEKG